ncbi:hypothetical protein C8J57DRAFT_1246027 [Mycena rebaudengoi]|nr:hypothetical protein C8J57DRAFT_1246027 [Mycena rebaudengoi]
MSPSKLCSWEGYQHIAIASDMVQCTARRSNVRLTGWRAKNGDSTWWSKWTIHGVISGQYGYTRHKVVLILNGNLWATVARGGADVGAEKKKCFGLCKYALVVELFWGETNHRTPTEISSIKEVAIAEQEEAGPELIRLPDVVAIKSDMIETRFWNWNYGFRPGNLHQYQEYSWADGGNYILKCSPSDYLQSTLIHVPFWVDKAPEIFTVISPSAIFVLRATVAKLHTVLGVVDSDLRE